jgi:sortase A
MGHVASVGRIGIDFHWCGNRFYSAKSSASIVVRERETLKSRLFALIAELAVLVGAVLCLQAIYQIGLTNFDSDRKALELSERLVTEFSKHTEIRPTASPAVVEKESDLAGFALLYIPALKEDVWALPILGDVTEGALAKGAGHYPQTAMPGEIGNFAVAAHRATRGEPFAYFERLMPGDRVIVQTSSGFFTYELFADEKIQESETWVISEQPKGVVSKPTALITLTTCDPRWNSTHRWARWGKLIDHSNTAPKELGQP